METSEFQGAAMRAGAGSSVRPPLSRGMAQTTSIPDLLTADDVAVSLRVPVSHVQRAAREGRLRHYRVGKRMLFTEAHVVEYLAGLEAKPPAKRGRPRKQLA